MKEGMENIPTPESAADRVRALRERMRQHPQRKRIMFEAIPAFTARLKEKYPDYQRYHVYHALSGSTVDAENAPIEEDFPGEDSAEAFLESQLSQE
jgi:hypothetical protein